MSDFAQIPLDPRQLKMLISKLAMDLGSGGGRMQGRATPGETFNELSTHIMMGMVPGAGAGGKGAKPPRNRTGAPPGAGAGAALKRLQELNKRIAELPFETQFGARKATQLAQQGLDDLTTLTETATGKERHVQQLHGLAEGLRKSISELGKKRFKTLGPLGSAPGGKSPIKFPDEYARLGDQITGAHLEAGEHALRASRVNQGKLHLMNMMEKLEPFLTRLEQALGIKP
jgi:hypothetical protein